MNEGQECITETANAIGDEVRKGIFEKTLTSVNECNRFVDNCENCDTYNLDLEPCLWIIEKFGDKHGYLTEEIPVTDLRFEIENIVNNLVFEEARDIVKDEIEGMANRLDDDDFSDLIFSGIYSNITPTFVCELGSGDIYVQK